MRHGIYIMNLNLYKYKTIAIRTIAFTIPILVIIFGIFVASQYGYLQIENQADQTISIETNQNGNSSNDTTNKKKYKKLVKKGAYNVTINKEEGSFFTTVKVGGFLQTKNISPVFKNVGEQEIVASNALGCSFMFYDVLYSYLCSSIDESAFDTGMIVKKQIKPTLENPGYTEEIELVKYGQKLLAILEISNQELWVLSRIDAAGNDSAETISKPKIILSKYTNNNLLSATETRELDSDLNLSGLKKYKDAVILYSKNEVAAYSIDSFTSDLKKLDFKALDLIDGYIFDIEIFNNYMTYYYVNNIRDIENNINYTSLPISILENNIRSEVIATDYLYNYAFMCGDNLLCIGLSDNLVIQSKDTKHTISSVFNHIVVNDRLVIHSKNELVYYDTDANEGTIIYTGSENNSICGLQTGLNNTVRLCADSRVTGDLYTLQLDVSKNKSINIVDAINLLAENNFIDDITVIGKYVYINDTIEPIYDRQSNTYKEDVDEKDYARKSILQSADRAGLLNNQYTVVVL